MKLTTKGYYALQSILDMINNGNERPVRLVDISLRQELPLSYLEQIFRNLRKGNIVKSVRGPGGGYVLSRDIKAITVGEVFTSVKELMSYSNTYAEPKKVTTEHTLMHNFFKALDKVVLEQLNTITLMDIIEGC